MISTIILDYNGIFRFLYYDKINSFLSDFNFTISSFFDLVFHNDLVTNLVSGKISRQSWWSNLQDLHPSLIPFPFNFVWDLLDRFSYLDSNLFSLIPSLTNLSIGILSNADAISKSNIIYQTRFCDLSFIFTSSDFGFAKPNPMIFTSLLSKINKNASQCLFFDDSFVNVTAANSVGIESFVYTGLSDFMSKINSLD